MSRQLSITGAQREASDRNNLEGVVYLLSGTLTGRNGIPDTPFYWSTREVTAFGQIFKPYIAAPISVVRAMGFEPGAAGSFPEVRIPVRNLPFGHSESLVAAITDDDFRVENTTATLRVAYLRPGKTTADLVSADYTPLVLSGFLGPPDEITLDGFVLPVFNRGARRNQSLLWPILPSPETMSGGAIDAADAGTMPPVVVGFPQDWVRVPSYNLGVRGFTTSGFDAGTTQLIFRSITVGPEDLTAGNIPAGLDDVPNGSDVQYGDGTGRAGLMIHYLYPVYEVVSATFDQGLKEFTITLASGLAADVPRGAFVQQWGPGFNPTLGTTGAGSANYLQSDSECYNWAFGSEVGTIVSGVRFGWLFEDGEVRPFANGLETIDGIDYDTVTTPWVVRLRPATLNLSEVGGRGLGMLSGGVPIPYAAGAVAMERGTRRNPIAPCYFDPLVGAAAEIATQPEFEQEQTAFGVINRPTGGSDAGSGSGTNADARDGSWATNVLVETGHSITLTFNPATAPFVDGDTTVSVLHIVARASTGAGVDVTDGVANTYFTIPGGLGTAEPAEFTVQLVFPANFNQELHFVSNSGGAARVVEAWWEHTLSATVAAVRTQDVSLVSALSPVGPELKYAELVVNLGTAGGVLHYSAFSGGTGVFPIQASGEFREVELISGLGPSDGIQIPYPSAVFLGLHMLLGVTEGDVSTINYDAYRAAHAKYVADNIRLGFVWTEGRRPSTWSDLENEIAMQSRSFAFYGPSGHELLYLESASGFDALPTIQSFRLPGTPGTNVFPTGQPLLQRTLTTELVNVFDLRWDQDLLTGDFRRSVRASNAESVEDIGQRLSDRGDAAFYAHTPWEGNANFTVAETVSGIAQFYADRQAFTATRFTFSTAWIAHGLDRGSLIRVTYPVSQKPDSFRNVRCEVESIEVEPLNGDRFTVVARSIEKPQKGIDPNYTWADVFDAGDAWTTQILQDYDTWSDYWSVQP